MSHIFAHPDQPQMQAEIILASISEDSPPIYTIRMRYPRIIHSEIMTHRVFSRNARSSRAVPVNRMIDEVRNSPFVPWHWLKNEPGMQGTVPLEEGEIEKAVHVWLEARNDAVYAVERLFDPDGLNIHKQNPNRLLEPFMWIDVLVTSTEWSNFLWLRDHKDAEPHLQDLARLVKQAIDEAETQKLEPGDWHLPYITGAEESFELRDWMDQRPQSLGYPDTEMVNSMACKISAARCARISYKPFDGDPSYERELERYNSLVSSDRVHASPLEHQASPDTEVDRWMAVGNNDQEMVLCWSNPQLHGNLTGWCQFRKMIPNENHT